jgi:hypothetical protein
MLGTTRYTDRGEALGRALESAVTGVADGDTTSLAPPHNATQVRIMANIMAAVAEPAGGAGLVNEGLGQSFGNMAAAYMPEISQGFAGSGSGAVYLTSSESPEYFQGARVRDVARFLSAVAADPAGRAGIVYGESIYTGSLLEAHLADPSLFDGPRERVLTDIGRNAGLIEGIVGHSLADGVVKEAIEGEQNYNDALKAKGDFAKTWVSIGLTGLEIPAAYGGDIMGSVVGGGAGAVAGAAVDRLMDSQKMQGAEDMGLYASAKDLYAMRESVSQQTQWSTADALARHHVNLPKDGANDVIREAVNDGWKEADSILSDTKERPHG